LLVDLRKFPSRIMIPFLAWTCLPRPAAWWVAANLDHSFVASVSSDPPRSTSIKLLPYCGTRRGPALPARTLDRSRSATHRVNAPSRARRKDGSWVTKRQGHRLRAWLQLNDGTSKWSMNREAVASAWAYITWCTLRCADNTFRQTEDRTEQWYLCSLCMVLSPDSSNT
jgi:hypothetical protein